MNDLEKLLSQRAELDAKIQKAQVEARDSAIRQVRELMSQHGLSMSDLSAKPARVTKRGAPGTGAKVPAKYRDTAGNAWSGRGLKPKWLVAALAQGAKITDFEV